MKMGTIVFFVVLIISGINKKFGLLKDSEVVKSSIAYAFFDELIDVYLPDMIIFAKENDLLPDDAEN